MPDCTQQLRINEQVYFERKKMMETSNGHPQQNLQCYEEESWRQEGVAIWQKHKKRLDECNKNSSILIITKLTQAVKQLELHIDKPTLTRNLDLGF